MLVNITDYQASASREGSTYTVVLKFILEDGETSRDLGTDRIKSRTTSTTADTVSTGTGGANFVLPAGGSSWTGQIAGETLDGPDPDSELVRIVYGRISQEKLSGRSETRCCRQVTLEYEPEDFSDSSVQTRPPRGSSGDDPDQWNPSYNRTSQLFEGLVRPVKFLGHLERDDTSILAPIVDAAGAPGSILETTPAGPMAGMRYTTAQNALGEEIKGARFPKSLGFVDSITTYATRYTDPGGTFENRQEVINDRDVKLLVAVGGVTTPDFPVDVDYQRGTAIFRDFSVSSRIYRYRNALTGGTLRIPFFEIRTQFAVRFNGWMLMYSNVGTTESIGGTIVNARNENGLATSPIFHDRLGNRKPSLAGTVPGVMVYTPEETNFVNLIGASTDGGATIRVL